MTLTNHNNVSHASNHLPQIPITQPFSIQIHYGTMGIVTNVLTVVLSISFLTFVAFFGRLPVFRRTPIGFAHRAIWVYIPKLFSRVDLYVTGGRVNRYTVGGWNRLLYKKHPVVLVSDIHTHTHSLSLSLSRCRICSITSRVLT
jgi:hypothetical protein